MLLVPVSCNTVLGCAPLRPVRKGTLSGFMMSLRLFWVKSGVPPWTGKKLSLDLEKGMPLISVSAMIPVTTLADGWDPPSISCIKKHNGGVCGPGLATVALAATAGDAGPLGDEVVGTAGAAASSSLSIGGITLVGASAPGASESSSGVASGAAVAGNWPLGNVVVGGTVVATGLVGSAIVKKEYDREKDFKKQI
ncbi:hypothetical protein CISIN_1g029401mg [Citrus sinensis]|uniref:Uncharacterized protein n=1 Tax=Citrus sinensis TaxID=2711 RepID=A0A067FX75_CITSI|nr:hypothetical protein CISIN_1g029401mg [Citrus sinensis]